MNARHPIPRRAAPGAAPIAVLGPTNTGKTHYAIERMLAHESGMIGLPLRLLAREVYDRIVAARGAHVAALITGEEKIVPPSPRYWICTVEAMPVDREVAFLAIDEAQLAADRDRGRVFTSRLLYARGLAETLFLGSDTIRPILRSLFPDISFVSRDRLSVLSYAGPKKVTRLPRRSAIVGFSAETVYAVAELIRRQRGGAAVILGALSPRTRNAQAALYQSGEVDHLVATDAIGMGLNMDIDHVAFAARRKFDGRGVRDLKNDELAQIAGRAGRYMRDGAFGVTADCPPLDEETVNAIEEHRFDPVRALQWRSEEIDFSNLDALAASLNQPPPRIELQRALPGEDETALARLAGHEDIEAMEPRGRDLALLWDVCQTPDFRKVAPDHHARLLGDIYLQLMGDGRIASSWLSPRVERLDRTDGDIDAISSRIAHVRTWTYLSHRSDWVEDALYWQEKARAIEDSLSDALHEKLTQRFVDRRTSVLMKKLRDDVELLAGVTEDGEVIVEGQFIGRLLGFEFMVDPRVTGADAKRMRAAADRALAPELAARAALLANADAQDLTLREDGVILWRSAPVAHIEKGPAPLRPNLSVRGLETLSPHLRGRIHDRLSEFVAARIEGLLGPLIALTHAANTNEDGGLAALSRGVAFRLVENFGAMARTQFGDDLKKLDQDERSKLRKLGVRFGEYTLFMPALLKPAPARLLTMLWALWTERNPRAFEPPKAGLVSAPLDTNLPHAFYYAAGYRPSGARAIRIDMLERLAGLVRAERRDEFRGGFAPTQQMMSLVGCSGEEFEAILSSLGYRKETLRGDQIPKPKAAKEPAEGAAKPDSDAAPDAQGAPGEDAATAETGASPQTMAPAPAAASDASAAPDAPASPEAAPPTEPPAQDAATEAPAAESAAQESAEAAADNPEPEELVIWRFQPKRQHNRNRERRGAKDARRDDRQSTDGKPARGKGRKPGGRKDGPGGRQSRGGPPPKQPHRVMMHAPQHRKVADPNSPFAVLAGLKGSLDEGDEKSDANKTQQEPVE